MDKITAVLKLDLDGIPREERTAFKKDVGDALIELILDDVANQTSSVSGRRWKALSKAYAHRKADEHGKPVANLELTGELLDALTYRVTKDGVEYGWFDSSQIPKADGHNNFSGDSNLPLRQSIPKKGQDLRRGILDEIDAIRDGYVQED